jgi:DNA-binding PadR family transcriptional regulator
MSRLSTRHIVLGLMIRHPSYGYGLQQQMHERLGFLGMAESAVYKNLERLERDGLVEEAGERRAGRTRRGVPRILYRATPAGVEEFRAWMREPSDRSVLRDELQAKLALSDPADLPELLQTVEAQTRECLGELAALSRPSLAQASSADVPWESAARMMVDDFKTRWLESLVDWLNAIGEVMEARLERAPEALSGQG